MDTTLQRKLEEAMAQMDCETQILWSKFQEEIFKNFDITHSAKTSRNSVNERTFLLALCDSNFVPRLFAKIAEYRIDDNSHIWFFQPKFNFISQHYSDITFYFNKKVNEFSSFKDLPSSFAPTIIVGDKIIALISLAKETNDVEVYFWDCLLCNN